MVDFQSVNSNQIHANFPMTLECNLFATKAFVRRFMINDFTLESGLRRRESSGTLSS